MVSYKTMLDIIRTKYPSFAPLAVQRPNDTSKTYSIPGFAGTVGFITSMTHNFCGTCNRLRITSDGNIKVCLFGENEVSLRDLLREFRTRDDEVGGILPGLERAAMEERLLEVVGVAVKGKKKAHAGIPWKELKDGRNRPMILIGG
jgi:cyclic pyranopterin phosphate synthase